MARSALLNTDTEDLKEVLSNGRSYTVPPYQRDYSWKAEHWEDLWEDLLNVETTGSDHYMGTLVLETGERKHFGIIDGQQRLATLSVLILACIDHLVGLAEAGNDAEANRERASLLESSYIGAKDTVSLRIAPKLKLNANDDNFFQLNLAQRKPPHGGVRGLRDSERLLWNCFTYFRKQIEGKFSGATGGAQTASFVSEIVTEKIVFISVRVQDQLSAYTVFETLNARGLELTETDLLKNYLLSLTEKLSASQMESVLRQWGRITARVGVADFPGFLRHHLNSRREYVRHKQLFKTIKREVSSLDQVFELLDHLEEDAAWFEALADPGNDFWLDYPDAREHVRVLSLFRVSQFTPLVFAAKDHFSAPGEIVEILRYCAHISVRFNGVSRRSTHSLEPGYNRAALALRRGASKSLHDLRRSLAEIYIPDDEFEADFSALRLSSRGSSGKRLRYLLAQIERQLSNADINDQQMTATVEHILPESPAEDAWPQFSEEAHLRSFERLGNYALLEPRLNRQEARNLAFAAKREVYARSLYRTSQEVASIPEWTEQAIAWRQAGLARTAKTVWQMAL
jgi:hypothetical protein